MKIRNSLSKRNIEVAKIRKKVEIRFEKNKKFKSIYAFCFANRQLCFAKEFRLIAKCLDVNELRLCDFSLRENYRFSVLKGRLETDVKEAAPTTWQGLDDEWKVEGVMSIG